MEPRIWNKPRIWNTFAADRVLFHSMRGFTVRKAFTLLEVAISGTPPPLLTASPPIKRANIYFLICNEPFIYVGFGKKFNTNF